jgi:outer membrane protein assembly complex protein YaeT
MELVLRKDGFLDAAVDEPRLAFRADEGLAEATFPVRPGPRYVIGRLAFEGRSRLESSVVAAAAGISEGELFKPDALDPARERVERLYKAEGFVNARVESRFEARSGEGTVDLVFEIEENDRAVIDSVAISGNEITTDGTIGRELEFGPGAVVDARAFSQAQRRLYRLGVFQSIEIDAEPSPEAEVRNERGAPPTPYDVEVRVEEISPYYLRYGGQYDTETGLGGTIEFVRRNFLGRAIDTGAAVQADFREQAARAYLRSPYFLGARIDTSLSAFAGRIEEPAFTSGRLGASFQQQVRFRGSYVVSWNYTFERIRNLLNGVPLPYEPYDIGRLSLAVTRDKRASLFDSVKGSFISLAAEYAGRALASDFSYVRFLGQYFMYVPLGKSLTYAAAVRLGLGEGLGGDLVLSERFFAGGGSSIRGFGYREVGPTDPITGLPAGGNAVLIVNQELRFPIYKALGGTLFVDLGNVYPTVSGFDPFRVRKTAGAGLRVNLGFILGRLDLAFKLDRRSGESLCRLHFSLGQAF